MNKNRILAKIKYWIIPEGVYYFLAALILSLLKTVTVKGREERRLVLRNSRFKDLHKGKRGYILGCGPSIKEQDLKLLRNEICISVANFFVYPDYALIRPKYHCVAPSHPPISEENFVKWLKTMEPYMEGTDIFLGLSDSGMIGRNGLFPHGHVYYLDFNESRSRLFNRDFGLTLPLRPFISVSIMALTVALYLGFDEIYLLGLEHTTFNLRGGFEYRHFYKDSDVRFLANIEPPDLEVEFWGLENLWRQYKALRDYAVKKGVKIFNATEGGLLDLFPRVKYETLFK